MSKGKGNKLMGIAKGSAILCAAILLPQQPLSIITGRKKLDLSPKEWKAYRAAAGDRGQKLPKGFEKAQTLIVEG